MDVQDGTAALEIGGVALSVRELQPSVAFYESALGLDVLTAAGGEAVLGAGGRPLLTLRHRPEMLPVDSAAAGLFHVAYLLPSRADLGRWLNYAAAQGVAIDGAADHLVSEAVYLQDPEGNGIEIYSDRPRAEWQWQDGMVAMANDRLDFTGLRALGREDWAGAPAGTRIGHVHLQVGAIPAAEAFYSGMLGFTVTRRWPQAVFMSTGGYHHHIAVNTWRSGGAGTRDPNRAGLASVTLRANTESVRGSFSDPWGTLIHIETEGSSS